MKTDTLEALAWMAGLTLLWITLAVLRPTTTFHLAPALIPLMAPLIARNRATPPALVRRFVLLGGGSTVAIAVILSAAGMLSGPTLLPIGQALVESIVAAAGGTALGLIAARRLGDHPASPSALTP